MNFVNDRRSDRMIDTFINMGIWVADVNNEGVPEPSSMVRDKLYQFHHDPLPERDNTRAETADASSEAGVSKTDAPEPPTPKPGKATGPVEEPNEEPKAKCVDIAPGEFDVLVIHQGIIDKWWERHNKDKVSIILNDLRLSIPRVIVTTGRGRPDNIPDHEKVLPFSVIESSLFRRYPEKLILVNTIMNLLPYGKEGEKA